MGENLRAFWAEFSTLSLVVFVMSAMEQHTLKNVGNCLNTNSYFYLETSGSKSSNLYLNVAHIFNTSAN